MQSTMHSMPLHHRPRTTRKAKDHGIALLAVLWLIAALSLMLGGLQQVVRGEILAAGQSRKSVISNGLADAAIRLTLQKLVAEKDKPIKSIQRQTVSIFGNDIQVEITPLNGSIDLNNASISLLADAFEYGGGVPRERAQGLAMAAVQARDRKSAAGVAARFHAVEDLLGLPGLDYEVYAKIKINMTADVVGSGLVNPLAASSGTLAILAKGDRARAQQLSESRLANSETMDTTTLTATHIEMAPSSYLTIRATTVTPDNTSLVRSWRVDVAATAFGLPWRVLGIEQSVISPRSDITSP